MSWVIVSRETGLAVAETFRRNVADAIRRDRYAVLEAGDYLGRVNKAIKVGHKNADGSVFIVDVMHASGCYC